MGKHALLGSIEEFVEKMFVNEFGLPEKAEFAGVVDVDEAKGGGLIMKITDAWGDDPSVGIYSREAFLTILWRYDPDKVSYTIESINWNTPEDAEYYDYVLDAIRKHEEKIGKEIMHAFAWL